MASSLAISSSSLKPSVSSEASIPKDLFFSRHKSVVIHEFMDVHSSISLQVLAKLVAEYVTSEEDCFGAQKWLDYFKVDIDSEPLLDPYKFYKFWFGADPIVPSKQVYDTHLPPILRPRFVTHITETWSDDFGLKILERLIQNPRKGHSAHYYSDDTKALKQHGRAVAEQACWIIKREGGVAKGLSYERQKQSIKDLNQKTQAGYEEESSLIDLATVVLVRYAGTGERHLGNDKGVEKQWTYARAKEKIKYGENSYQAIVGGFSSPSVVRIPPSGLEVDDDCVGDNNANDNIVVAALRKFC